MKRLFFIWFFIPLISYCQTDSEFILQNSISVEWGKNCISEIDCFYLSLDSALIFDDDDIYDYYYTLYYSYENERKQEIDSGNWDDLGYDLTLYSFKSQRDNSYVVFLEFEYEHFSSLMAYYIRERKLMRIGKWIIYLPCDTCERADYNIENHYLYQKNDEIEFYSLKDVEFLDYSNKKYHWESNDWVSYKAGELIISFNIIDGTVKRVEK